MARKKKWMKEGGVCFSSFFLYFTCSSLNKKEEEKRCVYVVYASDADMRYEIHNKELGEERKKEDVIQRVEDNNE